MKQIKNINLIRKIAWSFHTTTGIELEELCAEATLAYLESLKKYDPSRGKITTYAWWYIHSHLKNYLKINAKHTHTPSIDDVYADRPVRSVPFWESLSQDAQQIVDLVLTTPRAFVCLTTEEAQQRVTNILTCHGWTVEKIQEGLTELTTVCCGKPYRRHKATPAEIKLKIRTYIQTHPECLK